MSTELPEDKSQQTSGDSNQKTTLRLQVDIAIEPDADAVELDQVTAQLREELLRLDVEDVERPTGEPAPPGTRAVDAAILGTLIVSTGPAVIGAVVRTLEGWLSRRQNGTIKVVIGNDSIELSDVSDEDQKRLIEAYIAGHATTRSDQ